MPNILAYGALIAWPVAAYALFRILPLERALVWSILEAYLLLPPVADFDYPLIPPLDKTSIPNLAAFFIVVVLLGRGATIFSGSLLTRTLILLFVASPIATTLLNRDPFQVGPILLPGLPISEALATFIKQTTILLPLFLARKHLATPAAQREILLALALGGLAYSLPMLLEVRLSPQLNVWIYGFFPHAFDQQIRMGGFRPVVFLSHGLYVAFFALTTVIAAFGLWRAEKGPFLLVGAYLTGVLVLCKTLGALVYAGVAVPVTVGVARPPPLSSSSPQPPTVASIATSPTITTTRFCITVTSVGPLRGEPRPVGAAHKGIFSTCGSPHPDPLPAGEGTWHSPSLLAWVPSPAGRGSG